MLSKQTRLQSEQLLGCSKKEKKMGWVGLCVTSGNDDDDDNDNNNNNNNNCKIYVRNLEEYIYVWGNLRERDHLKDLGVNGR
jgi:hypothetical protein